MMVGYEKIAKHILGIITSEITISGFTSADAIISSAFCPSTASTTVQKGVNLNKIVSVIIGIN